MPNLYQSYFTNVITIEKIEGREILYHFGHYSV